MAGPVMSGVWRRRMLLGAALVSAMPAAMIAQTASRDTSKCDSTVLAASIDSVKAALYVDAKRVDGDITREQLSAIATSVATVFTPPRPFRLSVFSGPAEMRALRRVSGASGRTGVERRSPMVKGVYRFWSRRNGIASPFIARASLTPGFDSSALAAVADAALLKEVVAPFAGEDSMMIEVSISTDSTPNGKRVVGLSLPVMPTTDAVASPSNKPAPLPEAAKGDTSVRGEVVLRFVVDQTGAPIGETLEVVRANGLGFLQSALAVLSEQRFTPATVRGCPIAQEVLYPFAFVVPSPEKVPLRH